MNKNILFSQKIELAALVGKWYIHKTNFPMWVKGDKQNPTLNYSLIKNENKTFLFDEVIYNQNEKIKSIKGYDSSLNNNNTSYKWKGKGILAFLSSKWQFVHFDNVNHWAIIYFEKTLFTPKGYDVISKNKIIDINVLLEIDAKLKELEIFNLLQNINQQ